MDGVPICQPGLKQRLLPGGANDTPAIAGHLVGQLLAVAGTDDVSGWIVSEIPGGKRDRRHMRFELPGRQQNGQPSDPSLAAGFQFGRDGLQMRGDMELGLRVQLDKSAMYEAHEIVPKDLSKFRWREHYRCPA